MSQERKQILDMLAGGKITADEAERLLDALSKPDDTDTGNLSMDAGGELNKAPKYLYVQVDPDPDKGGKKDRVNIKVPLSLIRAGIKLSSLIPGKGKDRIKETLSAKGIDIDLDKMDSETLNGILAALSETSIDIEDGGEKVRIFCK